MSHTPGLLFVGAQNDCLYIINSPPRPSNDHINPDQEVNVVAKIYPGPGDNQLAQLFAAAPDLLEVCRALVIECEDTFVEPEEMSPDFVALWKEAKAAIAKATGTEDPR